ncbi:MAG: hypothetical protein SF069_16120 [Phycisphaerae bacterium]|nr:hypothetical protein [Phycisphaerae bacterium]
MIEADSESTAPSAAPAFNAGAWVTGLLIGIIPYGLTLAPALPRAVGALSLTLAPFFAGLVAGKCGRNPISLAAGACELGPLTLCLGSFISSGEFPEFGRDLLPTLVLVGYSAAIGAVGAWISARLG